MSEDADVATPLPPEVSSFDLPHRDVVGLCPQIAVAPPTYPKERDVAARIVPLDHHDSAVPREILTDVMTRLQYVDGLFDGLDESPEHHPAAARMMRLRGDACRARSFPKILDVVDAAPIDGGSGNAVGFAYGELLIHGALRSRERRSSQPLARCIGISFERDERTRELDPARR